MCTPRLVNATPPTNALKMTIPAIHVATPARSYDVIVENGLARRVAEHLPVGCGKLFVVSTNDVFQHVGAVLREALREVPHELLILPGGEANKRMAPLESVAEQMIAVAMKSAAIFFIFSLLLNFDCTAVVHGRRLQKGYRIQIGGALPFHPNKSAARRVQYESFSWAWLAGKPFVTPDEVKAVALPTLRHRIQLRPEVELEGATPDGVLNGVLASVPVPR